MTATITESAKAASPRRIALASGLDAILVAVFAAIGRASHGEQLDIAGIWQTAWPFLAGLVAGWLITMAWRAPLAPIRTGAGVWAITLVAGMLLRGVSGQGVAPAFVFVTAVVLLVFLVGWRVIATAVVRRTAATR